LITHFFLFFFSFVTVTKFIRTGIADKEDYPLFFEKAFYETEVDENEEINHPILTVTARTHNECEYILYSFSFFFGGILFLAHLNEWMVESYSYFD